MKKSHFILLVLVLVLSCQKDEEEPFTPDPSGNTSTVVFDLESVPYPVLTDYGFFEGDIKDQAPTFGVLPYEVISPLFSDYAKKKRFIWMPDGHQGSYVSDGRIFDFQDGTVIIKTFYYDNVQPSGATRIIETRLLYKKDGLWKFADYVWNEDQTEAVLDNDGSFTQVEWIDADGVLKSTNYRIPSEGECHTCHKNVDVSIPIGPKPQNLNKDYAYEDGTMNQLDKWMQMGYIDDVDPASVMTTVDWKDDTQDLQERVRSYIDMNCGHCHREDSHCSYRPLRLAYSETVEEENLGICVVPDEDINSVLTHVVARGISQRSVMYYRMNTTDETIRMPLLGRTMIHEEGVALIDEWIESLDPPCN